MGEGGDSHLVDYLLVRQVACVTVLDISAAAIARAQARLGPAQFTHHMGSWLTLWMTGLFPWWTFGTTVRCSTFSRRPMTASTTALDSALASGQEAPSSWPPLAQKDR